MGRFAITLLLAAACAPCGLARADTAPATPSAKARTQTTPSPAPAAQGSVLSKVSVGAEAAAPLNPRWIAPQWQIKGLTIWVFTPGHFQRH